MRGVIQTLLVSSLLISAVNSLSVCDDIDITFVIDHDTVKYNLDGVVTFIDSIIEHGSSEYSAFSAYIYGNGINYYQDINLLQVNLLDTYGKHRHHNGAKMQQHLLDTFNNITLPTVITSQQSPVDITLQDAFLAATKQAQPSRKYKKKQRFANSKYQKHEIGNADDHNRYFVFDHFNKLMTNNNNDICSLFNYFDGKLDESIHFVMGQEIANKTVLLNVFHKCNDKHHLMHDDLFFYLDSLEILAEADESDEYLDDSDDFDSEEDEFYDHFSDDDEYLVNHIITMESIYHITCPSHMKHPQYNGHLSLSPHSQWIDSNTIIKCDLKYKTNYDRENRVLVDELDVESSYILVNDHFYDDNTFKVNDFLMAEPEIYEKIQSMGCIEPIYQIKHIEHIEKVTQHHNVIKLIVGLPQSPMDYIWTSNMNIAKPEVHPHARYKVEQQQEQKQETENEQQQEQQQEQKQEHDATRRRLPLKSKSKKGVTYEQIEEPSEDNEPEFVKEAKKKGFFKRAGKSMGKLLKRASHFISKSISKRSPKDIDELNEYILSHPDPHGIGAQIGTIVLEDVLVETKIMKGVPTRLENEAADGWVAVKGVDEEPTADLDDTDKGEVKTAGETDDPFIYEKEIWNKEIGPFTDSKTFEAGWNKHAVNDMLTITAQAAGQIDYDVSATIDTYFQGTFQWKGIFKSNGVVNIRFQVVGTVTGKAYFTFNGKVSFGIGFSFPIEIATFILMAGPVPIILKPYVVIDAGITTHDLQVKIELKCDYKETILVGYKYIGKRDATKRTKKKWSIDWGEKGKFKAIPKIKRKKYVQLADYDEHTLMEPDPLLQVKFKPKNGWFFERNVITKTCTLSGGLYSAEDDYCNVEFGFKEIYIEPKVGVQLYAALSLEAGLKVDMPIRAQVSIVASDPGPCAHLQSAVCKKSGGDPLKAGPYVDLAISGVMSVKLKMPAFIWGIKEFFVIKKIAKGIKKDLGDLQIDIDKNVEAAKAALADFKTIYGKFKAAFELLQSNKPKAVLDFANVIKELATKISLYKEKQDLVDKWKGKINKRKTQIDGVITRIAKIVEKPFKIDEKAATWRPRIFDWPVVVPESSNCLTVPNTGLFKIAKAILVGCCKMEIDAHADMFSDWYNGYDAYDEYNEYDALNEYGEGIYKENAHRYQSHLNAAPVYKTEGYQSNNVFVEFMVLDIFTILVMMICLIGCICLVCGAFVSYKYHESQGKQAEYNQLTQNDEQI